MRRTPNLNSLRLFLHVASSRNFSETARAVFLSQPALSRAIRLLEEELNVRLFDRNTRNVNLTPAGEALLPIVERLTNDFDRAFAELDQTFTGERGRIAVGALPPLAAYLLPNALAEYQKQYPHVEITIKDNIAEVLYQQIQQRHLDFAIITPPNDEITFAFKPVQHFRFALICPVGHPLSKLKKVPWSVFADSPFIAMVPGSGIRAVTDKVFAKAGIPINPRYECSYIPTAGGFVAAGLGITALPIKALSILDQRALVALPLSSPVVHFTIGVAHLSNRSLSPAAAAFIDTLKSMAIALQNKLEQFPN